MNIAQRFPQGALLAGHTAARNTQASAYPSEATSVLSIDDANRAFSEISTWPGYQASPAIELSTLSAYLGCGKVIYKDESKRFGLGSFKALGGAYAVLCLVAAEYRQQHKEEISLADIREGVYKNFTDKMTITTATDGNHGRSVAWGAQNAGCRCRIYIHREVSEGRKGAMEAYGAEVVRIDGDYDESVRLCAAESADNGWFVVSDTSYEGYMSVPRDVMAGYTVIASELLQQNTQPLTHVFVQAGVGGLAAAVVARLWMESGAQRPRIVIVESEHAACWLESIKSGQPQAVDIETETVMAGLSCGEVSELAWTILSRCCDDVVTLADDQIAAAMRLFADAQMAPSAIEAGECAVPGALALMAVCGDAALKESMAIDNNSNILVIGCEGATDPQIYRELLASTD